jgi:predicted transposase/invertase (TIGR01784 family)
MTDLLDPKNDYVFKRLFADAPALLAALINAVRHHAAPITVVQVRNPTIDAEELQGKYIVLDLLVEDARGAQYNVEMQVRRFAAWSARSTYYLARLLGGQLVTGDDYTELRPAIGIHLLDFDLFAGPEHGTQALWCFEMRDADNPAVTLGQELQLHLIELKKADRLGLAPTPLAAWVALFEHWQEDETMSLVTNEPVRAAFDKLKTLSADAEARRLAFVRERALRDEQTLLNEARAEGQADGEAAAMRRTAANMIRQTSLDDATIAAVTGLTSDEVTTLRLEQSAS